MSNNDDEVQLTKKAHTKTLFSKQDLVDLAISKKNPIYFIEKFVKIQHPVKGTVPLTLYPFQKEMILAFHENRFVIALTARQMGNEFAPLWSNPYR